MISVNRSASCGATRCHMTCVSEKPWSNRSGGPSPPTRAKMRPDWVLIHFEAYPGNRSARSGMGVLMFEAAIQFNPSLQANGSRECAPDDRLREAIHEGAGGQMDCFVASLLVLAQPARMQSFQ